MKPDAARRGIRDIESWPVPPAKDAGELFVRGVEGPEQPT